jgi:hypothetical protein
MAVRGSDWEDKRRHLGLEETALLLPQSAPAALSGDRQEI